MKPRFSYYIHASGESLLEDADMDGVDISFGFHDYRRLKAMQKIVIEAAKNDGVHGDFTAHANSVFWTRSANQERRKAVASIDVEALPTRLPLWKTLLVAARASTTECELGDDENLIDTRDYFDVDEHTVRWRSTGDCTVFTTFTVPIAFFDMLFYGYPKITTMTEDLEHLLRKHGEIDPAAFDKWFDEQAAMTPSL